MASASAISSARQRVKRPHHKTKTGCVTCKSRRVKCDERKPVCKRCADLKRDCSYEGHPPHELALSAIERTPETVQLQQFCMNTSLPVFKNLGRPFEVFWASAVPKFSVSEPAVAHIMVALAARQRASFHVENTSPEKTLLARLYRQHYYSALALLLEPGISDKPEMVLLCCLMFICMENHNDSFSNDFLHLRSGLRVLRDWKERQRPSSPALLTASQTLIQNTLEPIFARFEAAVSPRLYSGHENAPNSGLEWQLPVMPESFESLATARGTLYEIIQWVFSHGQHQSIFYSRRSLEFQNVRDLCAKWKRLLDRYVQDHPRDANDYKAAVIALDTIHELLVLLIKLTSLPNELLWANSTNHNTLQSLLFSIETLDTMGPVMLPQRRAPMPLLPRMVPALFTVAMLSRLPETQRRAVAMIKKIHRDNKHEDECFIARIAEGVMELQERLVKASHFQIGSMDSRIRPLTAKLEPGTPGRIVLTYIRPHVYPIVAEDSDLGLIAVGPPRETYQITWWSEEAPSADTIWLWPIIEFLRLAGSSALIGPNTDCCLCKTYGALFALMRSIDFYDAAEFAF